MTNRVAFRPGGASGTIAVTSTSQRIAFSVTTKHVYLSNIGTKECFVEFGNASIAATAGGAATAASDGSMAIPAGFYGVLNCGSQSNIAAICAGTDTTTLRVTPGDGE
jgi:hypothetical protein